MSNRTPANARAARGEVGRPPTSLMAHILLQYFMGRSEGRQKRNMNCFRHFGFKQILNLGGALKRPGYVRPARAARIFSLVWIESLRFELFTVAAHALEQYRLFSEGMLLNVLPQPERSHRLILRLRKKSILPLSQLALVRWLCSTR